VTRAGRLRALLTIAILGYFASRIDMREAGLAILRLDPGAAAIVLALLVVDRAVMVWRWLLLLKSSDTNVSPGAAARIYLISSFVGSFLPAGVGADAVRAYTLGRQTRENSEAVASVAVDRLLGMTSIVTIGLAGVIFWARRADPGLLQPALILSVLTAGLAAGLLWADHVLRAVLPQTWQASSPGRRMRRLADAVGRYRGRQGVLASVLVLSIGVQVLRVLEAYVMGRGIGIGVGFAYYLVFMPVGLIMLLLPISVSGFGLPQGAIVWMLRPQGVPDPQSFALSTLIVLSGLVGNLPGVWLYVRAKNT
jgi:uncharacterized membrane protein YbhN (UPF0104 family)